MRYGICALAILLCSTIAMGEDAPQKRQPNPEDVQKVMDATMGAMVPIMTRITDGVIEAQLKSAVLPETAERIATFKKNLYDALIRKGFSKSEAMQLVAATGIPSATPSLR